MKQVAVFLPHRDGVVGLTSHGRQPLAGLRTMPHLRSLVLRSPVPQRCRNGTRTGSSQGAHTMSLRISGRPGLRVSQLGRRMLLPRPSGDSPEIVIASPTADAEIADHRPSCTNPIRRTNRLELTLSTSIGAVTRARFSPSKAYPTIRRPDAAPGQSRVDPDTGFATLVVRLCPQVTLPRESAADLDDSAHETASLRLRSRP